MDEYIRLDTTIIGIDSLINKATTTEEAKVLFTAKDVIYSQQRYVMDVQPVNQWISVNDRLPNNYEEVLVASKLGNIVYFAWYDADISMFMGHSHMWTTREVTHWMPLPEPPKDGDAE